MPLAVNSPARFTLWVTRTSVGGSGTVREAPDKYVDHEARYSVAALAYHLSKALSVSKNNIRCADIFARLRST